MIDGIGQKRTSLLEKVGIEGVLPLWVSDDCGVSTVIDLTTGVVRNILEKARDICEGSGDDITLS